MNRRDLILGASASMAAMPAFARHRTQNAQPDMVLVIIDDPDYRDTLPNMPQTKAWLCNKGVEFANTWTDFSLCSPGRATLLTGQTAEHHGIGSTYPQGQWQEFEAQADSTILTWAKAAGYRTGYFGHLMNGFDETSTPPPGLDVAGIFCNDRAPFAYFGKLTMAADGTTTKWPKDLYSTTQLQQLALDFIASTPDDQPLLLIVSTVGVHGSGADPFSPTPDLVYAHAFDSVPMPLRPDINADVSTMPLGTVGALPLGDVEHWDHHWKMNRDALLSIDDMNSAIIRQLKTQSRWPNAHMAMIGDNGMSIGSYRYEGKVLCYPATNRVPFCWRGPQVPTTGQTRLELITNTDVANTMVDLMGLSPDRTLDGRTLRPLLHGKAVNWRDHIIARSWNSWALKMADGWFYQETTTDAYGFEVDMYDELGQLGPPDPYMSNNVAGQPAYAAKQAQLAARLAFERSKTA